MLHRFVSSIVFSLFKKYSSRISVPTTLTKVCLLNKQKRSHRRAKRSTTQNIQIYASLARFVFYKHTRIGINTIILLNEIIRIYVLHIYALTYIRRRSI